MRRRYVVRELRNARGDWEGGEMLVVDQFPWYEKGVRQETWVQGYSDGMGLHVRACCFDEYPSASCTTPNGAVYLDSCFEFFFSPFEIDFAVTDGVESEKMSHEWLYFNIEINCIGTCYFGFGDSRVDQRIEIDPEYMRFLDIEVDHEQESKDLERKSWIVSFYVPFELLEELAQLYWPEYLVRCSGDRMIKDETKKFRISKKSWHANFYRCGGNVDPQHAAWNYIEAPFPQFHRPEYFGELLFSLETRRLSTLH